jgi:hypothetical protein
LQFHRQAGLNLVHPSAGNPDNSRNYPCIFSGDHAPRKGIPNRHLIQPSRRLRYQQTYRIASDSEV